MRKQFQTVDSINLITVVIVKDMLAYKVRMLDSERRGLGSRPVARFSVTTCQRAHTAVCFHSRWEFQKFSKLYNKTISYRNKVDWFGRQSLLLYSLTFDLKIWIQARFIGRFFKKRAPGPMCCDLGQNTLFL